MQFPKEWKCMRCNKKKDKFDLIRVTKELCAKGNYKQFSKVFSIDLCEDCYEELFRKLLDETLKHNPTYEDYY